MRPAPRRRLDQAMTPQGQPNPVVAALEVVLGHQLLPEMLGREIRGARLEQRQNPRYLVDPGPARRNPTQAPVIKTCRILALIAIAPAPKRPLRDPQDLRRLAMAQITAVKPSLNRLELHQP